MTKRQIKQKFYEIQAMGTQECNSFYEKVATSLLETQSKSYLLRACEIRLGELDSSSALVETSELKEGEL
jgi:hypothetical protein